MPDAAGRPCPLSPVSVLTSRFPVSHPRTFVRSDLFTGPAARWPVSRPSKRILNSLLSLRIGAGAPTFPPSVDGSREHYFHFLLGYLLPVVHAAGGLRRESFRVLDCGPVMTPILDETLRRLDFRFEIVPVRSITRPAYVEAWDYRWKSIAPVRAAAQKVREAWAVDRCGKEGCPASATLLIQRSAPHAYYMEGAAEIHGYGTARRTIANWPEICAFLDRRGVEYTLYEPGSHALGCQIRTFARARRLVCVRGAELANLIWCPPGVRVRVSVSRKPTALLAGLFQRLAIQPQYVAADTDHPSENPEEVFRFLVTPHPPQTGG